MPPHLWGQMAQTFAEMLEKVEVLPAKKNSFTSSPFLTAAYFFNIFFIIRSALFSSVACSKAHLHQH